MSNLGRPAITGLVYFVLVFCAGVYFTFAAVQGEMGLFRRAEIAADRDKLAANKESASLIGKSAAAAAREQGIEEVIFDRSGARYHGKVAELADAAREGGLKF